MTKRINSDIGMNQRNQIKGTNQEPRKGSSIDAAIRKAMGRPISRRSFLARSALLLAPSSMMSFSSVCAGEGARNEHKGRVIVVGAGTAGLSASRMLKQAGYQVQILEASSRTGGRIHTDTSLGVPVDLGAAWLHGAGSANPLVELFDASGAGHFVSDADSMGLYRQGAEISDELYEAIEELYDEWMADARSMRKRAGANDSMQKVLDNMPEASPVVRQGLRYYFASDIEIEYAADARELSLKYWDQDEAFQGPEWFPRRGYSSVMDYLASGLSIQHNTRVTAIRKTARGVSVESASGNLEADYVIVTVSAGVLQSESIRFEPALSSRRQSALGRLKMGNMLKVVLEFRKPFWPDLHRFGLVSSRSPIMEFWNLRPLTEKPILVGLLGGEAARKLESASGDDLVGLAMDRLKDMFGSVSAPARTLRSSWHSNPLTRGSYSIVSPGSNLQDQAALGQVDDDRILFAGEACHSSYPSTVHGALLSGQRAAQSIMKMQ